MNRVAVIPARGGSKRIPGKNIRPFAGRPIIAYAIAAAQEAGVFSRIIVSTDDEAIAAVARAEGCDDVLMRDPALADDHTPLMPVVKHVLIKIGFGAGDATGTGRDVDAVCAILPTAVFLQGADLRESAAVFAASDASFVVPVVPFEYPVGRALVMAADGHVAMHQPENLVARSQDLPTLYHDTGTFYWCRPAAVLADERLFDGNTAAVPFDRRRAVDIDTEEDWTFAEHLYRHVHGG